MIGVITFISKSIEDILRSIIDNNNIINKLLII